MSFSTLRHTAQVHVPDLLCGAQSRSRAASPRSSQVPQTATEAVVPDLMFGRPGSPEPRARYLRGRSPVAPPSLQDQSRCAAKTYDQWQQAAAALLEQKQQQQKQQLEEASQVEQEEDEEQRQQRRLQQAEADFIAERERANRRSRALPGRPVIKIHDGRIRGRKKQTESGKTYFSFQGIPYAKPPIGQHRFMAPKSPDPWRGVKDAGSEGNMCIQPPVKIKLGPNSWALKDVSAFMATIPTLIKRGKKILSQSEDCLYLNVYTPEYLIPGQPHPLMPVVVWIHGGGFLIGDGDSDVFGPDYFIDEGIIVVSINYRLGPFGFLSVGTDAAPGNAGLKDQALALRWVYNNIRYFGGDRRKVTIYGESAGAASAHLHTLSPMSRGLFSGAIAGSGSALHDWAINHDPLEKARGLCKALGITDKDPDAMVAALKRVSAKRIMAATLSMNNKERFVGHELAFVPVVEHRHEGAFLCEEPAEILLRREQACVPLMIGTNTREGLLWLLGNPTADRHDPCSEPEMSMLADRLDTEMFLPDELYYNLPEEKRAECHEEIVEFYFGNRGICKQTMSNFLDLFGDVCFLNPLYSVTKLHSRSNFSPVFVYCLTYDGNLGFFKRLLKLKYPGVAHSDELGYLFRVHILPEVQTKTCTDQQHQKMLIKLWSNFIYTGNPTPQDEGHHVETKWEPAWQGDFMSYMDLGKTMEMRYDPPNDRMVFWNSLYIKYLGRSLLS